MSNARENILQQIRQTLDRQNIAVESEFQRLAQANKGEHYELGSINNPAAHFIAQSKQAGSHIIELDSVEQVPQWLTEAAIQPTSLALSPQQEITCLDWSRHSLINNYQQEICTAVVKAPLAAAETGTVLLNSGIVPSGLLFLVETLVIVLDRRDIKPRYEDLWAAETFIKDISPVASRAVHLITGPSRTADVEQQIQVGAHGPREVFVLLIDQR